MTRRGARGRLLPCESDWVQVSGKLERVGFGSGRRGPEEGLGLRRGEARPLIWKRFRREVYERDLFFLPAALKPSPKRLSCVALGAPLSTSPRNALEVVSMTGAERRA